MTGATISSRTATLKAPLISFLEVEPLFIWYVQTFSSYHVSDTLFHKFFYTFQQGIKIRIYILIRSMHVPFDLKFNGKNIS